LKLKKNSDFSFEIKKFVFLFFLQKVKILENIFRD